MGSQAQELIRTLMSQINGEHHTIIVHRKKILKSTLRAVTSKSFNFNRPPYVVFSGEDAEDNGGPRREFFT